MGYFFFNCYEVSAFTFREEKPDVNNQGPPGKMPKSEMQSTGLPSSAQLFEQAQSLIDEINSKRKNDTVLLESE